MSGKGDDRLPASVDEQTFSDNWERIFAAKKDYYARVRKQNYADSLRLEGFSGLPERSIGLGSNPSSDLAVANVGSNPTAAATHEESHGNASEPSHRSLAQAASPPSPQGQDCQGQGESALIYINADTGEQVDESWWPGDEINFGYTV